MTSKMKRSKPKQDNALTRTAPNGFQVQFRDVVEPFISKAQFDVLAGKTPSWAIKSRPGKAGQTFEYVPHGYVTSQLNKAFGFGWSFELRSAFADNAVYEMHTWEEEKEDKRGVKIKVTHRYLTVCGRLTVHLRDPKNPREELLTVFKDGFGSQEWQNQMEFGDALKGARSDAIKTCATQLGLALDLYFDEDSALDAFETRENARKVSESLNKPNTIGSLIAYANMNVPDILKTVGVKTIDDLTAALEKNADKIIEKIDAANAKDVTEDDK